MPELDTVRRTAAAAACVCLQQLPSNCPRELEPRIGVLLLKLVKLIDFCRGRLTEHRWNTMPADVGNVWWWWSVVVSVVGVVGVVVMCALLLLRMECGEMEDGS